MLIVDLINPPWQTANIFVLFNAFETFCFPQCITDMSRVYFSSVHFRKSCKYIHFAVRSGLMQVDSKYAFNDSTNCKGTIVIRGRPIIGLADYPRCY